MKRLMFIWMFVACVVAGPSIAQEKLGVPLVDANGKTIPLPTKVPPGKTFVLFDAKGNQLKTYAATVPITKPIADCVEIPCPSNFKAGTQCWRCSPRS